MKWVFVVLGICLGVSIRAGWAAQELRGGGGAADLLKMSPRQLDEVRDGGGGDDSRTVGGGSGGDSVGLRCIDENGKRYEQDQRGYNECLAHDRAQVDVKKQAQW